MKGKAGRRPASRLIISSERSGGAAPPTRSTSRQPHLSLFGNHQRKQAGYTEQSTLSISTADQHIKESSSCPAWMLGLALSATWHIR